MRDTFLLDVQSIKFDDSKRQRTELREIEELMESIKRVGLIAPIVVDGENNLIAGRRRLEAHIRLGAATIAARRFDNLSPIEQRVVELDENIRRVDLSWQDRAKAIEEIHTLKGAEKGEGAVNALAQYLGLGVSTISTHLAVAAAIRKGDEKILSATSLNQAYELLRRRRTLEIQTAISQIGDPEDAEAAAIEQEGHPDTLAGLSPVSVGVGRLQHEGPSRDAASELPNPGGGVPARGFENPLPHRILQADFLAFASSYAGPKFNFIHCDFPYGIGLDKSDAAGVEAHDSQYADSAEVFWRLTAALCKHKDRLFLDSAHMLFWFSMKYYDELVELLETEGFFVHNIPLIWHKSDGMGIASDYRRRPKHVYETALWCSLGDRPLVQLKNDLFACPSARDKEHHVSAKPKEMLEYFFSMGVNDLTHFLDPTCGSGTSIRAAKSLGAARAIGLELNPETAKMAQVKLSLEP